MVNEDLKVYAQGEQVFIKVNAAAAGEEIVSVGRDVPTDIDVKLGAIVSIPNLQMQPVPDPRQITSGMTANDPKRHKMTSTHYKNITAVYK